MTKVTRVRSRPSKERFTLDEGLSKTVRKVFVELYKKGLIYKGKRITNWDPVFKTAISDIEVEREIETVLLYTLKYELEDGSGYIPVATTRPETIFADSAVAVHPSDERYQHLIGKQVIVPISGQVIPIISDHYPKKEFGTGAVKVTPAHDANDYQIGKRHQLPMISVMNEDATMNEHAKSYQGLDRFEAREKIVKGLDEKGLLLETKEHETEIGYSERSKAQIEPMLSLQWFVKMDELAKNAIDFQQSENKLNFHPKEAEDRYIRWISNIEDWCISRQLWWGHQIPVWYCDDCNLLTVEEADPIHCSHCGSSHLHQDEDVLDTWFSSSLWAYSTLDWMDESPLYKRYYPTDALVTAYDIILFWVSRMIFMSLEFTDQKPFKDVLIHGLVLDENGKKMSKSKGNGIDPLELIEENGADALRLMLLTNMILGNDLKFNKEKLESARNFEIKLWNASRYILMNMNDAFQYEGIKDENRLTSADKWILNRLNKTIKEVNESFDKYDFSRAGNQIKHFFKEEYCDWYIELTKSYQGEQKTTSMNVLIYTLRETLKLLHPFMPFITEEIWSNLPSGTSLLMLEAFPEYNNQRDFEKEEETMKHVIEIITQIRAIRKEANSSIPLPAVIKTTRKELEQEEAFIRNRGNINFLIFQDQKDFFGKSIVLSVGETEIHLPFKGLYNIQDEKNRLKKELEKWQSEIDRSINLLKNNKFMEKAKPELVEKEKEKLKTNQESYEKTQKLLEDIEK